MKNFVPSDLYQLQPIGIVRSELTRIEDAPKQGREGAPDAWIDISPEFMDACDGLTVGEDVMVLTWLHQADRNKLKVRPRCDPTRLLAGVFSTRSPHRPNPIGLHRATVLELDLSRGVKIYPLEAIDGTPVIDIKSLTNEVKDELPE